MCKGIKKGVGCCVVALSRIAEDRGDRRKHDETIECHAARAFMKQPGTERFRAKDARHSLTVESSQRRIVNKHGEMEHATQRLAVLLNVSKQAADVVWRTGIGFYGLNHISTIERAS